MIPATDDPELDAKTLVRAALARLMAHELPAVVLRELARDGAALAERIERQEGKKE